MERGELDGRCGGQLTVIKSTRPHWLTERKFRVPILDLREAQPAVSRYAHHHGIRQGRADARSSSTS